MARVMHLGRGGAPDAVTQETALLNSHNQSQPLLLWGSDQIIAKPVLFLFWGWERFLCNPLNRILSFGSRKNQEFCPLLTSCLALLGGCFLKSKLVPMIFGWKWFPILPSGFMGEKE